MNKEIEFRVYDYDLKKMRYLNNPHDSIWFDENGSGYYENMQTGPGEWFSYLMQYTGLKDKNGKKIFEGDILREYSNEIEDWVVSYEYGKFIGTSDNIFEDLDNLSYCMMLSTISSVCDGKTGFLSMLGDKENE